MEEKGRRYRREWSCERTSELERLPPFLPLSQIDTNAHVRYSFAPLSARVSFWRALTRTRRSRRTQQLNTRSRTRFSPRFIRLHHRRWHAVHRGDSRNASCENVA